MGDRPIRIGIVGATGYGGSELVRLLAPRPGVEIVQVTSARLAGRPLSEASPWIDSSLTLSEFSTHVEADVVFLCQETGFSSTVAPELATKSRVIDLAADYRLTNKEAFEATYKKDWPNPTLGAPLAYGLPEIGLRPEIAKAQVVANPGCHATTCLLAALPAQRAGMISGTPVFDSKSGVSGAGRGKVESAYLYSELAESTGAYAVVGHRHIPEIEQHLGQTIRFTPHLVPLTRGIEVTLYFPTKASAADLKEAYTRAYASEPFVKVVDSPPSTKQVRGSNRCDIFVAKDDHAGFGVVSAVIDNLVKGAAGQAIQNMNLMLGLEETEGLPVQGVWP